MTPQELFRRFDPQPYTWPTWVQWIVFVLVALVFIAEAIVKVAAVLAIFRTWYLSEGLDEEDDEPEPRPQALVPGRQRSSPPPP